MRELLDRSRSLSISLSVSLLEGRERIWILEFRNLKERGDELLGFESEITRENRIGDLGP